MLTISFNEIAQKKGEPCSSKKDAKKAKENKSKGKGLTQKPRKTATSQARNPKLHILPR